MIEAAFRGLGEVAISADVRSVNDQVALGCGSIFKQAKWEGFAKEAGVPLQKGK